MDDLLALAESLDLGNVDIDHITERFPDLPTDEPQWSTPPRLDLPSSLCEGISSSFPDILVESHVSESPTSPTYRNRVLLFGGSDEPAELLISTESSDPRTLYVIDHPGRNAQFKNWFLSGLIIDDSRRVTFREESSMHGCWYKTTNSTEDDKAHLLNLIRVVKPEESSGRDHAEIRTSVVPVDKVRIIGLGTQIRDVWDTRCFMVGGSIMVAMSHTELDDSLMRAWCMWFNDKLCSWGVNDRSVQNMESQDPTDVFADLDFSGNRISDVSLTELMRLLGAFRRVRVRTLRLSSNSLTHDALEPLKSLPYLNHLVMDDNHLTSADIISWIPQIIMSKQERYDILVAQDIPDESVKQTLFMSVERNRISRPLELLDGLIRSGINACVPESSGCEPYSTCRLYGTGCGVHLAGLSEQLDSRFI